MKSLSLGVAVMSDSQTWRRTTTVSGGTPDPFATSTYNFRLGVDSLSENRR
jgi:hypothetical protein